MTKWALLFILLWLATFVSGQLLFKRAMELSRAIGFRKRQTISTLGVGILVMTTSFCLNLGLLQRFEHHHHQPARGRNFERTINTATDSGHAFDHRRRGVRLNELTLATIVRATRNSFFEFDQRLADRVWDDPSSRRTSVSTARTSALNTRRKYRRR